MTRKMASRMAERRSVNGLVLLDKPQGLTSNAALQRVKRLFNARKAGHTGSLDPLASGMLPICMGHATKISAYLLDADKCYRTTAQFGCRTDTADADGRVIEESGITAIDRAVLEQALEGFRGEILQVPPMYSALKQGGKRLYELAREGKEVAREPRKLTIHSLEIEAYDPRRPVLRIQCSKGTYIRTLVEDIAAAAGTLGHVAALRRLAVSPFSEAAMVSMETLERAAEQGFEVLDALLLPVDQAISNWPAVSLGSSESYYLLQGNPVSSGRIPESGPQPGLVRLYGQSQRFLGIGEVLADGRVAPRRLFVDRSNGGPACQGISGLNQRVQYRAKYRGGKA